MRISCVVWYAESLPSVAPGGLVCIREGKADVPISSHQWKDSGVGNDIP